MSFEWLNIPGLEDTIGSSEAEAPPAVSFNFSEDFNARNPSTQSLPLRNGGGEFNTNSNMGSINTPSASGSETKLTNYVETQDDLKVPLSLSSNQLTKDEVKTYLRWYGCIALRKRSKLIKLEDVFRFLSNFPISDLVRTRIAQIFKTCKNALNIGEFFAVLRLVSHSLKHNVLPTRKMILDKAPVPTPKPILSREKEQDIYEEVQDEPNSDNQKVDFDSFASLLLTGQTMRTKIRRRIKNYGNKVKKVRFSENLVTFQEDIPSGEPTDTKSTDQSASTNNDEGEEGDEDNGKPLDLSLPMDQLLKKLSARKHHSTLIAQPPSRQPETQEEKEVLEDMRESLNHFQQIHNVDSVSIGGVPSQIPSIFVDQNGQQQALEPLKPTSTGSANHLFRTPQVRVENPQGNLSTAHESSMPSPSEGLQPLRPTATGSANYLMKQHFTPTAVLPPPPPPPLPRSSSSSSHTFLPSPSGNVNSNPPPLPVLQSKMDGSLFSPQPQPNDNLIPGSTAGDYFQSLLSNTPSPSASAMNLATPGTNGQPISSYNNSYQQQHPQQLYPNVTGTMPMNYNPQPQHINRFTPSPVPQQSPFQQPPANNTILGDLRALQLQVDQLHNSYNRK